MGGNKTPVSIMKGCQEELGGQRPSPGSASWELCDLDRSLSRPQFPLLKPQAAELGMCSHPAPPVLTSLLPEGFMKSLWGRKSR